MSVIRVNFLPEFDFGNDAVLVTMDGEGVDVFRSTVVDAIEGGASRLDHEGVTHVFLIETGAADVDLEQTRVVWHLDPSTAGELAADLEGLAHAGQAGHYYVDIRSPAPSLVVSRDEYVDVVYPWVAPPSANIG